MIIKKKDSVFKGHNCLIKLSKRGSLKNQVWETLGYRDKSYATQVKKFIHAPGLTTIW